MCVYNDGDDNLLMLLLLCSIKSMWIKEESGTLLLENVSLRNVE